MLLLITTHTIDIPHISLLSISHTDILDSTGGSRRHIRNFQYRGASTITSTRWLFWHLHQSRWRCMALQQQCDEFGGPSECGPGPTQPDMVGKSVQGYDCIPIPHVSIPDADWSLGIVLTQMTASLQLSSPSFASSCLQHFPVGMKKRMGRVQSATSSHSHRAPSRRSRSPSFSSPQSSCWCQSSGNIRPR